MILRPYQREALNVLDTFWDAGGGNPLIELATGTGKSVLIAEELRRTASTFSQLRALVVVHVREC
jgi:DNA repair protein RadD